MINALFGALEQSIVTSPYNYPQTSLNRLRPGRSLGTEETQDNSAVQEDGTGGLSLIRWG